MVRGAVALVPGGREGSVGLPKARRLITSRAAIGDLPPLIDSIQNEVQEGPCLDSIHDQQAIRVGNLRSTNRWPRFAERASVAGAASILSLPLYARGDKLGALNLYSHVPNAFTDESELIGVLYAAHAAIALAGFRRQAQLREAVLSRDLIGQAKGILMERYSLSDERAFLTLTRISQGANRKLHDIADELVRTRTLVGHRGLPRSGAHPPGGGP